MPRKKESRDKNDLTLEIEQLLQLIEKNEQIFNMTTDENLIEAVIYEQKALQQRYAYLLKIAREQGISIDYIDRI